jgi:hypothetical protein
MNSNLLDELSQFIGARLLIQFKYQGKTYKVEPHLLGKNYQQQDCLLAWVSSGLSHTNSIKNNWHTFLLNNISELEATEQRFSKQRPGYDPYESSMSRIYYRI